MAALDSSPPNHAIVFGASGLAGWGVVDQLFSNYPSPGTFAKVTAVANRPLNIVDSFWPSPSPSRPILEIVSGIDLAKGADDDFPSLLEKSIQDVSTITHVFYFPLKPEDDPKKEVEVNSKMLERVVVALNRLSPILQFVVFPGGTKAYGIHIPGGAFTAPFTETMGRLPSPHDETLTYYAFRAILQEQSRGKNWTWCEVCPDAVIGFTPNGSNFSLAGHWASYLSTYALVEGQGAKVPFPGTIDAYKSQYNEASAEIIAKCAIWAALHPEKSGNGQMFNVADQTTPSRMSERWPALARYFGLEGVSPSDDPDLLKPSEFVEKHLATTRAQGLRENKVFKGKFLDSYGYYLTVDRQLSLEKVRSAGFGEEIDPNLSWFKTFDRFKAAGMIPS